MVNKVKYLAGKIAGKAANSGSKVLPFNGNSLPGLLFIKTCGLDGIKQLQKEQVKTGSVMLTGTNGKTTTTTMTIELLSKDNDLTASSNNNTVYAVTTALLRKKGDIGVFEYGIRDKKHGIPHIMNDVIDPIGVVYTNISREHTQVASVKNSFEDYINAKTLLSENMKNGVVITNADDPRTNFIGQNKEKDGHVIYYGLSIDYEDIFGDSEVKCPKCGKPLTYTKRYMNHRGDYSCSCGFKRSSPDVTISNFKSENNKWVIRIDGDVYNYHKKGNVKFSCEVKVPIFGLYNLYNIMCASATYACFTRKTDKIETTLTEYFNSLSLDILPPGRFELLSKNGGIVGIGQGDNGDALIANCSLMKLHVKDEFEFIYTTPDEFEEEIFEDHKSIIKNMNPDNLIVLPGRVSVDKAREYYNELKTLYPDAKFYPVEYDIDKRIEKINELVESSKYKNIIISGCGDEYKFWDILMDTVRD